VVYCNVVIFHASLLDGRFGDLEFVMEKDHGGDMCGCSSADSKYY
jgi:hypothetical protein